MSETQQALLLNRSFFVTGLRKLHANGQLKLTPESVAQNYSKIHDEASRAWAAFWGDFSKHYFSSKPKRFAFDASASSILRWNRRFTRSGERLDSLRDNRGQTSKLDIDQESYQFIMRILREYLLEERFSATATAEKAVLALKIENEIRTKNGQRLLETRSKSTLCEWIARLSPFEVKAGRHGLKAAKEEFASVGKTDAATRPGQAFEVDEWEIDALTRIAGSVLREGMDAEMLSRLPTGRRWLYVVIDVATRYVVGVVVASSQNSSSAIRALEMATRDKGDLARAAGSPHEWHGFPFESVRSDTGSAFRAKATQRAVSEVLATYIFPIVGEPGFRPYIERFFRTISLKAMPYFPGQTFANVLERGDYDSEAKAVLTDDQLALIFIRFFLDVYHQTPHSGLLGETPENALRRLSGTVGVPPAIPKTMRRRAFGIREERVVTARGIQFFSIHYNSDALQTIRRQSGANNAAFYVDTNDLGCVSVWSGAGWLEVPCSIENFNGVTLLEWLEVGKLLRRRYAAQAELKSSVVFEALSAMRATSENAMALMGVLPQVPTSDQLKDLENNLFWGLSISEDAVPELNDLPLAEDGLGYVVGPVANSGTDRSAAAAPAVNDDPNPAGDINLTEDDPTDDDTDWWRDGDKS
jgi:transposase InsO family protein